MSTWYDNTHFFEPVRQIIGRVLTSGPLRKKAGMVQVWSVWEDAVGAGIAAHARPMRLEQGTLTIQVDTPVWHHQLQMLQGKVITELNVRLGRERVKTLRFQVG